MPAFKRNIVVEVARGVKAYLNLEAGVTRRQLVELRKRPAGDGAGKGAVGGANPENFVWIFGSGRSGSTWLSSMMGDMTGQVLWGEPWVGTLFGRFYYSGANKRKQENPHFILGRHKETWIASIRSFILDAVAATFPGLGEEDYLVIKEPNGSIGAPLMMEALPESRMILLVRDPRDVIASSMDGRREGSWNYERNKDLYVEGRKVSSDKAPDAYVKRHAKNYMGQMGRAKEAYDAHKGRKTLVRYEELRADALGTMKRMYSELGIKVDDGELSRVIDKHSWENIPEEEKGEGKFYRKATPGGWRDDLTPEQAGTVEKITAPLMQELYPS